MVIISRSEISQRKTTYVFHLYVHLKTKINEEMNKAEIDL